MKPPPGRLLLVPNTLDLGGAAAPMTDVLPQAVMHQAAALGHWAAENPRSTRAFLKRVAEHVPLAQPLQAIHIVALPRPQKGSGQALALQEWEQLLAPALAGHDLGLHSEAGLPAVADPGAALVAAAHRLGVPVQPLAGPSSLLLALAASGLNGQSFAFVGYLPQEAPARAALLRDLETLARRQQQTQLIIETPYRNAAVWLALLEALSPSTVLSVSCGLTMPGGFSRTATVAAWRQTPLAWPDKLPAVFLFLPPR
jgi:16S rRNA (cytidine1402-2'-O)-methyltransferase